ncbi:MAG TPA: hypothetical protein VMA77_20595 [Solirubrobacteraceae bacterium]|nr:hypothetical protein [Solirubrobacteraceae bacterium]
MSTKAVRRKLQHFRAGILSDGLDDHAALDQALHLLRPRCIAAVMHPGERLVVHQP